MFKFLFPETGLGCPWALVLFWLGGTVVDQDPQWNDTGIMVKCNYCTLYFLFPSPCLELTRGSALELLPSGELTSQP